MKPAEQIKQDFQQWIRTATFCYEKRKDAELKICLEYAQVIYQDIFGEEYDPKG